MASTNINKPFASSGTRTKWTWSFWVKRGTISNGDQVISTCHLDNSNQDIVRFSAADRLEWWSYQAGSYSNGGQLIPNRLFRDCYGWYHIVLRWDSSNSTAGDRMKIWVNGVEETSFNTDTNPTSGRESLFNYGNNSQKWIIGSGNDTQYFDGSISHMHFSDGHAYDASTFGETDSTTGEWKIKTSPSFTLGTNGFTILKDGNTITDQSSNSNDWSLRGGTLTKTEDCPSNVFNTMNDLYLSAGSMNLTNANLKNNGNSGSAWRSIYSTLGASSGKYYFEMKVDKVKSSDLGNMFIGIVDADQTVNTADNERYVQQSRGYGYHAKGNKENNSSNTSWGNTWYTVGDIIGCAFDLDNGKIYFSKNGSWQESGDPTSGSTGTGSAFNVTSGYTYLVAAASYYDDERYSFNFGNGVFATTAVASAGTNASNNGIFEYDVPSGYTALSTKGLNL
jgi:hypothetical protein